MSNVSDLLYLYLCYIGHIAFSTSASVIKSLYTSSTKDIFASMNGYLVSKFLVERNIDYVYSNAYFQKSE